MLHRATALWWPQRAEVAGRCVPIGSNVRIGMRTYSDVPGRGGDLKVEFMPKARRNLCVAATLLVLEACGGGGGSSSNTAPPGSSTPGSGGSGSTERGTLIATSLSQSLSASQFTLGLSSTEHGRFVLGLSGTLTCDIDIHHIEYWTVAPTPPATTATPTRVSAALMIPTGSAAPCSGARPTILFARGFHPDPTHDTAKVTPTSSDLRDREIAASYFAAQGYIVIAPNRAGYDISTLGYEPYLNADQNSKDMMDALTAGKTALSGALSGTTTSNGKLFVVGTSEGGFVAMATDKALQAAGIPVVATALVSGIYAVEALGDEAFLASGLGPQTMAFLTTSYQSAYGNVYSSLTDIYQPQFTPYITSILSKQTTNQLPAARFNANPPFTGDAQLDALLHELPTDPLYARGFGNPYLVTDSYRQSYVMDLIAHPDGATPQRVAGVPLANAPQNALRQDLRLNDMRSWTPKMPMLLCGGNQDHNVRYDLNTETMVEYWSADVASGLVTVLDIDTTPTAGDPYAVMKTGFQQWVARSLAADGSNTMLTNYHPLTAFFCMQAVRQYLAQF
jgi:hypothetical protein